MDYSFYGGRRGISFILSASFKTISEMVEKFQLGNKYTDVGYDEYVLIDTVSKNDKDNGKVFRRGLNWGDENGGAIYIGQIVGPTGQATITALDTYQLLTSEERKSLLESSGAITSENKKTEKDFDIVNGISVCGINNNSMGLVPGKVENIYNDEIKCAYYSFRAKDGTESNAYIGFQFPYTVFDYSASSIDQYDEIGNIIPLQKDLIKHEDIDNKGLPNHPFYSKWHLSIPKGIKGEAIENVRVYVMKDDDFSRNKILYPQGELAKDSLFDGTSFTSWEEVKENDIINNNWIIIGDIRSYEKTKEGIISTYYIGDYNIIKDILFEQNGSITINYTHQKPTIKEKLIKWIKAITFTEKGNFEITLNDDTVLNNFPVIKWIKEIVFTEDGKLKITLNDGTVLQDFPIIKWLEDLSLTEDGFLKATWNTLDEKSQNIITTVNTTPIKWINNVEINKNTQKIKITYNTSSIGEEIGEALNYISYMVINDEHHLLVWYSDPEKRKGPHIVSYPNTEGLPEEEWYDLGYTRSDSGILIGKNIPWAGDIKDHSAIVQFLNQNYSTGLEGDSLKGKIITVGNENNKKVFFAFDYEKKSWYYLGDFEQEKPLPDIIASQKEPDSKKIADNGIWLILEEVI